MSRSTPGAIAAMVCGGNRWMQNHIFHEGKLKQKICIYINLTRVTEEGFGFGTSFMDLIMIYWENRFFFTVSHIFKLDSLHLKYRFSEFSKQIFQLWASALPIWRAAMVYWPWYWSVRGVAIPLLLSWGFEKPWDAMPHRQQHRWPERSRSGSCGDIQMP